MSKSKFVLNRSGVRELLRSEGMKGVVEGHASRIKNSAGEGYNSNSYVGKNRVNAMVYADSMRAKNDNKKNNTLLKSVR